MRRTQPLLMILNVEERNPKLRNVGGLSEMKKAKK
jgi:hypothetical protein